MLKKNSFVKICDMLEENYILQENQITYIKKYLVSDLKICEDKDMLLKIKAEAEETDYNFLLSSTFSMLAMFFTALGVLIQLLPKPLEDVTIIKIAYLIAVMIILIPALRMFGGKFNAVKKWRKYVLVVVNQLIEQQSEKEVDRIDKKAKKLKKRSKKTKSDYTSHQN